MGVLAVFLGGLWSVARAVMCERSEKNMANCFPFISEEIYKLLRGSWWTKIYDTDFTLTRIGWKKRDMPNRCV